ncbi:hypothetical protein [Delftia sp. RIT313]|uniref:hypothetical protein n=1 Tax=Delftia sp. RIT313 TaxID=1468410 RepID=UPI000453314C|nr:hypothetical protein [Delftia sp. RIT313]EZP51432.1 Hypothetical protein precursor [Delftia sp. RIT313]
MNARPPCLASRDADALAARESEYDAEDAALDAYTLEHYGPPFAPEFVEEALHKAPFATAKKIAGAGHYMAICSPIDDWLRDFATQCARQDMQEARNA